MNFFISTFSLRSLSIFFASSSKVCPVFFSSHLYLSASLSCLIRASTSSAFFSLRLSRLCFSISSYESPSHSLALMKASSAWCFSHCSSARYLSLSSLKYWSRIELYLACHLSRSCSSRVCSFLVYSYFSERSVRRSLRLELSSIRLSTSSCLSFLKLAIWASRLVVVIRCWVSRDS